jgi:hypothetical protein
MSTQEALDPVLDSQLGEFLETYDISAIRIAQDADIRDHEASLVEITFRQDSEGGSSGCRVNFKILGEAARTHRFLLGISAPPNTTLELTQQGLDLGGQQVSRIVRGFIDAIAARVAKVHKEQSILGIQPVGMTFVLHGRTRFEVLSDNGKGQLTIRILKKDGSNEAGLAANDLLDGLYSGVITRA